MSAAGPQAMQRLRKLLADGDPAFADELAATARSATAFEDLIALAALRKRSSPRDAEESRASLRLAMVGAYTLHPLDALVELLAWAFGLGEGPPWRGEYDNHVAEILDPESGLYAFGPDVVVIVPSAERCRHEGDIVAGRAETQRQVDDHVRHILDLCETCRDRSSAEIVLCNYPLPALRDLGAYRTRTLASDWSFRKAVNLELGLQAPPFVHMCDLEFLAARRGATTVADPRRWFESKQLGSPSFLVDVAREVVHLARSLRAPAKKVLVLDLDNTLWGGVVGDDGIEGIELGSTSPRGEAYRAFQHYVASLRRRGVLLAVCSKNDHERAVEAVERHPEMVLRMADFVAFKANWDPKPDNLRAIAAELNLGLDSFVFADDNPAEIEIVRRFTPQVETILLGPDPSEYVAAIADSRMFEPLAITAEDRARTEQYRTEVGRKALLASVTDMATYLESLEMRATVAPFRAEDVPRITQLINKSNQFNVTTRRRTESEIVGMLGDGPRRGLTIRLADRFGDHGLIAVVIAELLGETLEIDTWVMSCRVLKRQVEEETLNAVMRLAQSVGARTVRGRFLPTPKNAMVRDLYVGLGFRLVTETASEFVSELDVPGYDPKRTPIRLESLP